MLVSAQQKQQTWRSDIQRLRQVGIMSTINSARLSGAFLLSIVAMLFPVPAFAQIDLSGEWAVRSHEDPGQPRSATIWESPSTRPDV